MTVIAWDGKTLAADKRGTSCGYAHTVTKIRRAPNGALVGCTGSVNRDAELFAWYADGADPAKYPASERDESKCSIMLVIEPGPVIKYFNGTPFAAIFEERFTAAGSGRDYALAAMHLGRNASAAVEVACALDTGCGNGIDTLTLD